MATEMITLKLEETFLKEIDETTKKERYHNRTEFIRNALRKQIDKAKMKEAMMELVSLRGKSKKKISDAEYERIRNRAFESL